jgi:hypothetical protein
MCVFSAISRWSLSTFESGIFWYFLWFIYANLLVEGYFSCLYWWHPTLLGEQKETSRSSLSHLFTTAMKRNQSEGWSQCSNTHRHFGHIWLQGQAHWVGAVGHFVVEKQRQYLQGYFSLLTFSGLAKLRFSQPVVSGLGEPPTSSSTSLTVTLDAFPMGGLSVFFPYHP